MPQPRDLGKNPTLKVQSNPLVWDDAGTKLSPVVRYLFKSIETPTKKSKKQAARDDLLISTPLNQKTLQPVARVTEEELEILEHDKRVAGERMNTVFPPGVFEQHDTGLTGSVTKLQFRAVLDEVQTFPACVVCCVSCVMGCVSRVVCCVLLLWYASVYQDSRTHIRGVVLLLLLLLPALIFSLSLSLSLFSLSPASLYRWGS